MVRGLGCDHSYFYVEQVPWLYLSLLIRFAGNQASPQLYCKMATCILSLTIEYVILSGWHEYNSQPFPHLSLLFLKLPPYHLVTPIVYLAIWLLSYFIISITYCRRQRPPHYTTQFLLKFAKFCFSSPSSCPQAGVPEGRIAEYR